MEPQLDDKVDVRRRGRTAVAAYNARTVGAQMRRSPFEARCKGPDGRARPRQVEENADARWTTTSRAGPDVRGSSPAQARRGARRPRSALRRGDPADPASSTAC